MALRGITRTSIQDTLFNANGTLANGQITIQWNGFTAGDGSAVAANSLTLRIVNGVLRVDLAPNPAGTSYVVTYLLDGKRSYTETWVVPVSGSPLRVGQVRAAAPAAGGSGGGAPNLHTLGGFTGVGPTAFSPGATWEVYDATPGTGVTRQVLRSGAGQGAVPLLSFYSGTHFVGLRAPSLGSDTVYTLPPQDGLPGSVLKTDGLGNLTWGSPSSAVIGEFYQTFMNAGTALSQRHNANFLNGLQAVDNPGADQTDVSPVYGASANTVAQGNDARFPTAAEKAALAGTNGSPGGTNRYVTDSDPRNTNPRTPTAHAATHAAGGGDPVTPGSIGALKNTSDILNTGAASNIGLIIRGAPSQAASLQEWQDSNGNLLASVTSTGRVFFQEAFFSPKAGETATSFFFQINNLNRFSATTFANAWNFNRYDDAGNFKDVVMQFVRNGDTSINTSLLVNDPTPATGATRLTVKAGAGQGSTSLQEWQSDAGTVLSRIDANGFFQFPAAQKHGNTATVQMFSGAAAADECAKFDASGNVVGSGAPCGNGGGSPLFYDAVTPTGAINGSNTVFTLPQAPNPAASLILTRNGLVQKAGTDYTLSGLTITFVAAATPQSGDILLASFRAGLAAGGPLVDTADRGYFFGVSVSAPESSGSTTAFAANVHRVWQFVLPFAATVNQLSFEVVTASGAGASMSLGLWDAACSTLVLNSGVLSAGGSPDINTTGVKIKTISGGPVTLPAGTYWLAMTTNSTSLTLRSLGLPSQAINLLNAQTNKKFAQAGNNGSSGAFPSSCGTLATAVSNQPPMVLFER